MSRSDHPPDGTSRWGRLRFSIVGPLLSSPPAAGELRGCLEALSSKEWIHPIGGQPVHFSFSTIERWYYQALAGDDPLGALCRKRRSDSGTDRSWSPLLKAALVTQYREHPGWSRRLHYDNLAVLARSDGAYGPMPSYSTLVRGMNAWGLLRRRRRGPRKSPGARQAEARFHSRETRGFEVEFVNGLWHLDFHHGSRKVSLRSGRYATPILLGVLDDCSRLICHAQWYLSESAETLAHGLCQAFQKRGLPRSLMTDNGGAMMAAETREGLLRLGVLHETTLPYSPHQNGKQESFWGRIEGRLLPMLEGVDQVDLAQLNRATVAWVEMDYNRKIHSETGVRPVDRFAHLDDVGRQCPEAETLRRAFTTAVDRVQRRSDGTASVQGVRFEIPSQYRHLKRVTLRYWSWDLARAFLCDPRSKQIVRPLFPQDKTANAQGLRRRQEPPAGVDPSTERPVEGSGMAPLLSRLLAEYVQTGLVPSYLPKAEEEGSS